MRSFPLILIVALILAPTIFGSEEFKKWIHPLHHFCLSAFEGRRTSKLTYEFGGALICGKNLPPGPLRQELTDLGLYHVLVVSGAHLTWVTAIIMFLFPERPKLTFLILLLFSLMTGMQAPVLRSLIEVALRPFGLPSWVRQLGAVTGGLIFNPSWIYSRSLFLSALARQTLRPELGIFLNAARVQIILLPLLMDFFIPSLQGVFLAGLLSLALELVLFPLLLVVALFPSLGFISEWTLEIFLRAIQEFLFYLPPHPPLPLVKKTWPPFLYWAICFGFLAVSSIRRQREWFFRKEH